MQPQTKTALEAEQPNMETPPLEAYEENHVPALPSANTNIEIRDGVITAQKVAVPRSEAMILKKIKTLAAYAGQDWYYRWPTKNKDGSKGWVEGPSVKCAMAVARVFGNCTVDCRSRIDGQHIEFLAKFVDIETGFSVTRPFRQRIGQDIGGKMAKERAADLVFQIGTSKATRNVICNALETFVDFAFSEARESLITAIGKNIEKYRAVVLDRITEHKIDLKRVEAAMGRPAKDWLAPDIAKVRAILQSVTDGMSSKDEAFPPTPEEMAQHEKDVDDSSAKPDVAAPSNEQLDIDQAVEELLLGLVGCPDIVALNELIKENEPIVKAISEKGSRAAQEKWAKAFSAKVTSFKKTQPKK